MKIKVMGTGCKKCKQLFENVQQAAANMGMQAEVEYVTDMAEIVSQGIMTTPALIMEGRTVSTGKLLTVKEIETLLS